MLDLYIKSDYKRCRLWRCPVGEHMNGFAGWLHSAGYQRRPGQLALRAAAHLGHWISALGVPADRLDNQVLDAFACHVPICSCHHPFQGHDAYHAAGARRFVEYLQTVGTLPKNDVEPDTIIPLAKEFCDWMRQHRGVAESTLAHYLPRVEQFIAALGDDATTYDAGGIRAFIFARAGRHGSSCAKPIVNPVRMFLRFLAAYGYCSAELIAAVPRIADWKLSSLPCYISAEAIAQLIAACDPTTTAGARDRAIMLLLARLGLRAGDVRDLRLADIDWPQGRLRVIGKGRCETWLPLPQAAGDALLHYLAHFRPTIDDDHVFLRIHAPLGAVLRHRCIDSTAHYAKVDVATLRSVAQPWSADGESLC